MPVADIARSMLDTYPRDFNVDRDVLRRSGVGLAQRGTADARAGSGRSGARR
jgi:hypothetical protein